MKITFLSLFPDFFPGPLAHSITGRGLEEGKWSYENINIRDFATDKHHRVDDSPYGGGAGMVMRPDVVAAALRKAKEHNPKAKTVFLAPAGHKLTQEKVEELSHCEGLILLCGHYEGIDQRVIDAEVDEELSIGDYVLTGGELPAMVLADAVVRQIPGVLGNDATLHDESFTHGLLEYPHYTRPVLWEEREVPAVLRSGNHAEIDKWRQRQGQQRTVSRRPDIFESYVNNKYPLYKKRS